MNQPLTYTVTLSFLPFADNYTFSAKEKDVETGLSYFGSRYYSSDLSIWLSVDPMSDKYPSLSPYVYCANNPVRCVDPDGEEIIEDNPPGIIAACLRKWERGIYGSAENRRLEGSGDGANAGTMTKQDVEVAVAVGATMLSCGAALGAETTVEATVAIVSTVNNVDDATVDYSGQTASQRTTTNNSGVNKVVTGAKTVVSVGAGAYSSYKIGATVKNAVNNGIQVIQKEAKNIAANMASVASSAYSLVRSVCLKRNQNGTK